MYSPYCEARVMGLYAEKLGVPKNHIFYDTVARHSTENAFYSYLVAKNNGFKLLALATDPFQSALLQGFTNTRMGTPIYHLPFVMDSVKKYNSLNPKIESEKAKSDNFTSIVEEGRIRRFFGTLGGEIDWDKYDGKLPPL